MSNPILVLSEVFPPMRGGSGRWLWELYRRFPPGSVHVVAHAADGGQPFDQGHDLPITRLPLRFPNWGVFNRAGGPAYLTTLRALHRVCRNVRPRVIHCGKCLPEGFLARTLRAWGGPPYWCYVHGEELMLARTSRELRWMTRRALRGAAGIVANSCHTRDLVTRDWGVRPDRVHVLHPGVDAGRFVPAARDPVARQELGWGDRPVILSVGALQQRKGQDTMIQALPKILQAFPNVLYSIAGEGWERPYLEKLVAERGLEAWVQFRGTPTDRDLLPCYQQCDLFALPNRQVGWDFEGFGIVLLEAQACGKPVLTGASGGTAETLKVGETGVVVNCTSPDTVADAVVAMLGDAAKCDRMGAAGRVRVAERFDWSALVPQAVKLFGDALAASARPAPPLDTTAPSFL